MINKMLIAFSNVTSCSSKVIITSSGNALAEQLVYKSITEVFKRSNDIDASI